MARVLILHAPEDALIADALGRELSAYGHNVLLGSSADPALAATIPACNVTVVIWSYTSITSERVAAAAATALALDKLVSARLATLEVAELPPPFQALPPLVLADVASIARAVAALEPTLTSPPPSPESERPPPQAPRRVGGAEPSPNERPTLRRSVAGGAETEAIGATRTDAARLATVRRVEGVGAGDDAAARARREFLQRVTRPEGVGAADGPRPRPVAPAPATEALQVEAGKLVHKIPSKMWLGEPETVEVRVGREAAVGLAKGLAGRGGLTEENIPVVETMSVSLYSKGGAFEIERQSETTQLIKNDQIKSLLGTPDYGQWIWLVTPRKTGSHNLVVKISAGLKDSRGVPTSATLPDREFAVSVSVHAGKQTMKVLGRFLGVGGGAIAAALIGAITQDLWWPQLKALLVGWGLLS